MAVTSVGTGDTPNQGRLTWNANDTELEGKIDGHTADTVDAHDASAISFTPTGSIASTDVQGAIAEVASEAGGGGAADASTTVKGISKTSVAPASSTNPIAVGDNDPRVTADQAAGTASIRTLGTGAVQAATGNHTHAGGSGPPFSDSLALVQDNIDSTKKMNIECSSIATGQWRTLTMPNADTDLAALANANIASGAAIAESKLNLASDAAAGTASRRTLGTGATQAAPGNDTRFNRYKVYEWTFAGTLTAGVTGGIRARIPTTIGTVTVVEVGATLGTVSSSGAVTVDVNKALQASLGTLTTLYTTQGNRPSLATSARDVVATLPDVTSAAGGDHLTVDIDAFGTGAANLYVYVVVRF